MIVLLLVPLLFILAIVLPILTYRRTQEIARRLAETEARLRRIENASTSRELVPSAVEGLVPSAVEGLVPSGVEGSTTAKQVTPPMPAAVPQSTSGLAPPAGPPPAPSFTGGPVAFSASADASAERPVPQAAETLEAEIGSRWMLVVGTVVLVLGVALFVKYSFDQHWISESVRVMIGTLTGILVYVAGLYFARHGYALYGQIVAGGGLVMVYVAAYAAHALYAIVAAAPAFAWMASTSAAVAATADRQRSIGLALLAIALGFAVPFLVAGSRDHHIALFVFNTLLIIATFLLVRRHEWPLLSCATFYLTAVTFVMWFASFYTPDKFAATETYLTVACALVLGLRREHARGPGELARVTERVLWLAPVLYHAASIAVLFEHSLPFLLYLILVTTVAVGSIPITDRAPARLVVWVAVASPFSAWIPRHAAGSWYFATLATAASIYLLHLFGQVQALAGRDHSPDAELALFHANGLGLFGFTYATVEANGGSTATLAFLLAAWNGGLAFGLRRRTDAIVPHALALTFTFAAVGVALALTGPWITVAWAAEGAAVVWTGLVTRRAVLRFGGALLLALAVIRLVALQFDQTFVSFVPLVNSRSATGGFIVVLMYALAMVYRRHRDVAPAEASHWMDAWLVSANVLTVALLTADIYSFWAIHEELPVASFARELTISITWTVYGLVLVTAGFQHRLTAIRYLALALFGVTVVKMFAVDLLELDGIYRITGFIVLGLVLLGASFLYQRFSQRLSGGYASS